MTDKFQNRYRILTARLENRDYGLASSYFVTICTKNRNCYFGEVVNGEMALNELGKVAYEEWQKTPQIRADMNLELDEFVVMPNHFHGILMIGANAFNDPRRDAMLASQDLEPRFSGEQYKNKFAPQSKNLSSIIRGFKSSVSSYAKGKNIEFGWQERFHDHIIRNTEEFANIAHYIYNNPVNWGKDKYFR